MTTQSSASATSRQEKQFDSRYPVLVETKLLKPIANVIIPARTKSFSVAVFYQFTGLHLSDTFLDRFGLNARQRNVDPTPERPYVALLLKANAYNQDIRLELPKTHLSRHEDIAGLIEAQPSGKSGFLLTNGWGNIVYVEGEKGVVDVSWCSASRRWHVRDLELDHRFGYWPAGCQVICPGTAVL